MNYQNSDQDPYKPPYATTYATATTYPQFAANVTVSERVGFIQRTYLHLGGAILVFALIDFLLLSLFPTQIQSFIQQYLVGNYGWLVVLGCFMVVNWVANSWAHSDTSRTVQYAGLALYVVAQSIIFLPLLLIANMVAPGAISSAAIVTAIIFGGLTATVFVTKADFSFLRMYLVLGGLAAMCFIVCSIFFNLGILGTLFSVAMIVLASGYILYDTSNVLHHYRTDQHVAASLALFSSVAILLWYVIQLFMSMNSD
jgi:FtsH-binding integral membrane protein